MAKTIFALMVTVGAATTAQASTKEALQKKYIACGMSQYDAARDRGQGRTEAVNFMFGKCKPIGLAIEKTYGRPALDEAGKYVERWVYRDVDPLQ